MVPERKNRYKDMEYYINELDFDEEHRNLLINKMSFRENPVVYELKGKTVNRFALIVEMDYHSITIRGISKVYLYGDRIEFYGVSSRPLGTIKFNDNKEYTSVYFFRNYDSTKGFKDLMSIQIQ